MGPGACTDPAVPPYWLQERKPPMLSEQHPMPIVPPEIPLLTSHTMMYAPMGV